MVKGGRLVPGLDGHFSDCNGPVGAEWMEEECALKVQVLKCVPLREEPLISHI